MCLIVPFKPTILAILSVNDLVVSPFVISLLMVNRPDRGNGFSRQTATVGFAVNRMNGWPGHTSSTVFSLASLSSVNFISKVSNCKEETRTIRKH